MEHLSMKSSQLVLKEIEGTITQVQALAQSGQIDPAAAQQQIQEVQMQMQNPSEVAKLISLQEAQLLPALLKEITPAGEDPMADPLVQIRMQELGIKRDEEERKAKTDAANLMIQNQKMQAKAAEVSARLETQEEIADDRNQVNRERIAVQREARSRRN
jgi:hypothetical protein